MNIIYKKYFIISLLFVLLLVFSLSCVSASNIYVEGSNDSVGDGSSNNPYSNLKIAVNKSNSGFGDTIIIGGGKYKASDSNTNLIISRNVSIYGAKYYYKDKNIEDTVIDGGNYTRFFNISKGVTVNIYGITFINGNYKPSMAINSSNSSNYSISTAIPVVIGGNREILGYGGPGGAIYNEGTLNIDECKFENNLASNHGGAIYNSGNCNIIRSIFINNTALRYYYYSNYGAMCGGSYYEYEGSGGAITNNNGNLTILYSNFTSNNATTGAAVYSINNSNLTIEYSGFYYNSVAKGAIYSCKSSNLSIIRSNLINNGKHGTIIFTEGKAKIMYNNISGAYNSIYSNGNSTIMNNNIFKAYYGIYNYGFAIVEKNIIKSCVVGIYNEFNPIKILYNILNNNRYSIINYGSYSTIYGNTLKNISYGISNNADYVNIKNNNISAMNYGIYLYGEYNNLYNNFINSGGYGIKIRGNSNNINAGSFGSIIAKKGIYIVGHKNILKNLKIKSKIYLINVTGNKNSIFFKVLTKNIIFGVHFKGLYNRLNGNIIISWHYCIGCHPIKTFVNTNITPNSTIKQNKYPKIKIFSVKNNNKTNNNDIKENKSLKKKVENNSFLSVLEPFFDSFRIYFENLFDFVENLFSDLLNDLNRVFFIKI